MKFPWHLILSIFILIVLSAQAIAADDYISGSPSYNSLTNLKTTLSQLLAENSQLEKKYKSLHQLFVDLQKEYKAHAAEIAELKNPHLINKVAPQIPVAPIEHIDGPPARDYEAEILVSQSQVGLLKNQLLDADERLKLLRLKYSESQYTKREMEIAAKIANVSEKEDVVDEEKVLAELKRQHENNLEQEKHLLQEIELIKTTASQADVETKRLQEQNEDIETQIKQLESRKIFKEQENAILRDKKLYQTRLMENQIWQTEQKKVALENRVNGLESEYNNLNTKLNASLSAQAQNRELLDELMKADQYNQDLKSKITELQGKIKTLQ